MQNIATMTIKVTKEEADGIMSMLCESLGEDKHVLSLKGWNNMLIENEITGTEILDFARENQEINIVEAFAIAVIEKFIGE